MNFFYDKLINSSALCSKYPNSITQLSAINRCKIAQPKDEFADLPRKSFYIDPLARHKIPNRTKFFQLQKCNSALSNAVFEQNRIFRNFVLFSRIHNPGLFAVESVSNIEIRRRK
jgi:hypothetical protein